MPRSTPSPFPSLRSSWGGGAVLLLAVAFGAGGTACAPSCTDSALDSPATLVSIEGLVVDGYADDTPIGDAWVVVDLGNDWIVTRTGADGSFTVSDLPAASPVTLSVLAEDRVAITYEELVPGQLSGVIVFNDNLYRDLSLYDFPTREVTGTVSGWTEGSYLIYYGDPYLYDFDTPKGEGPAPFAYDVDVLPSTTDIFLSAMEYDLETEATVGTALGVESVEDETPFDLTLSRDLAELSVSVNRPAIGGVPLEHLASGYCADLGFASPTTASNAVTGWASDCDESGERFQGLVHYLPSGLGDSLSSYVGNDNFSTFSGASLPIPEGTEEVEIDLMDAAEPDATGNVTLGDVIGFEADSHATSVYMGVEDAAGTAWYILNLDDSASSLTIPTFPDTLDTSLLLSAGDWQIISTHYVYLEDGTLDEQATHTYTLTTGGSIAW